VREHRLVPGAEARTPRTPSRIFISMSGSELAPTTPRTPGEVKMMIVSGVALAISALLCAAVTKEELAFAHQATCGPDPPVESRHEVLFTGLTVYAVFVLATAVLMWRGRTLGLIFAMILAIFAIGAPILTFLVSVFSAAMC
jgi:hypothetical protein